MITQLILERTHHLCIQHRQDLRQQLDKVNPLPKVRKLLEATFHLREWDDEARTCVRRASERLLPLIEPHATRYMSDSGLRPKKMSRSASASFLASLGKTDRPVRFELESGPTDEGCGPWSFSCSVDPEQLCFSRAGHLRFSFPAEQLEKDPAEFQQLFIDLAGILRAESGQGGFGVGFIRGYVIGPRDQAIRGWIIRYRGLDLEDPSSTSSFAASQIKGPGWLTFLGTKFCEQLGGQAALARALSEQVQLFSVATGAVLIAGRAPRLGDVNAAEDMSPYAEVARLLKPLRMPKPLPLPGLDHESMAAWLSRFDQP